MPTRAKARFIQNAGVRRQAASTFRRDALEARGLCLKAALPPDRTCPQPSPISRSRWTSHSHTKARCATSTRSTVTKFTIDTADLIDYRSALWVMAESAIEKLVEHGLEALPVERFLSMLDEARAVPDRAPQGMLAPTRSSRPASVKGLPIDEFEAC